METWYANNNLMVHLTCHESMAYPKKILQRSGMSNTLRTTSFSMGPKQIGSTIRPLEDLSTLSYDFMVTFHLGSIENLYIPNFLITLKKKNLALHQFLLVFFQLRYSRSKHWCGPKSC